MSAQLSAHAFANIFPKMPMEDLDLLVGDIRLHGLREPIVLYEGQILDGRNRYEACLLAHVEPRFREYNPIHGDPLDYVVSVNVHRRHLDPSQRGLVGARVATIRQGRPKKQGENARDEKTDQLSSFSAAPQDEAKTIAEAAQAVDVGEATIKRARQVLEQGTPELIEAVEQGEIAVSDAAQVSSYDAEIQNEALRSVRSGRARTAREAAKKAAHAKGRKRSREHDPDDEADDDDDIDPITDELGHEVPTESLAAFAERDTYRALGRKFDALRKEIEALAQGYSGHYLRMELQSITQALRQAKAQLLHSMPYCIAPDKPHPPKWLSDDAYKRQAGVRNRD